MNWVHQITNSEMITTEHSLKIDCVGFVCQIATKAFTWLNLIDEIMQNKLFACYLSFLGKGEDWKEGPAL